MSIKDVLASVKSSFTFKKEVKIAGNSYELSVLSMEQEKKVNGYLDGLNQEDSVNYLNELRKSLLSESITAINGTTVDKVVSDVDIEGKEIKKDKAIFLKEFLSDLPSIVIAQLFDAYVDVKEQQEDMLKKEMKYDWFKTPAQREKELEEETKKQEEEAKKSETETKKPETEAGKEPEDVKLTKVTEVKEEEAPEVPKVSKATR
jgi:hypothetical protein